METDRKSEEDAVIEPSAMDHKMCLLLSALQNWYSQGDRMNVLMSVLGKDSTISLRMLDWLVTNFSRKTNVHYDDKRVDNHSDTFNVFMSYKTQLRAYSKRRFDPFKRRDRILFEMGGHRLVTTVAQLNFFKWAIENGVVTFAAEHAKEIEADMVGTVKKADSDTRCDEDEPPRKKARRKPQRGFDQRMLIRQGNIRVSFA